jgi:basic amino acid/polyamine antiporter, APA family
MWLSAITASNRGRSGRLAPDATLEAPSARTPREPDHRFGLPTATALVVGSIVGVGIFNLPTSLAGYGPITLVSMALTTVGAIAPTYL